MRTCNQSELTAVHISNTQIYFSSSLELYTFQILKFSSTFILMSHSLRKQYCFLLYLACEPLLNYRNRTR